MPRYLESAMSNFARQQQQMRLVMQQTFSPFMPMGVEEMGRQNIALLERAMAMFNPFHRPGEGGAGSEGLVGAGDGQAAVVGEAAPSGAEVVALRHEVESLRAQLAVARAETVINHAPPHAPPVRPEALPMALPPVADASDAPNVIPVLRPGKRSQG